jgi:hypothetical protein
MVHHNNADFGLIQLFKGYSQKQQTRIKESNETRGFPACEEARPIVHTSSDDYKFVLVLG